MMNKIIGFIGCGNMGKAMLGSLISSGEVKKENILVSVKTEASKEALEKEFEVKATNDNKEVAAKANKAPTTTTIIPANKNVYPLLFLSMIRLFLIV